MIDLPPSSDTPPALTAPADPGGQTGSNAAWPPMVREKLAKIVAQCPPPAPVSPQARAAPIHVDRWGKLGPRVILVHGGIQAAVGGGPETFDGQRVLADKGWQVWRVDRPGFGQTPSRGPDDMTEDSRWLSEMFDGGAHLIGHSWGGGDVMLAAARNPKAVKSIILIEPAVNALFPPAQGGMGAMHSDELKMLKGMMLAENPADFGRAMGVYLNGNVTSSMARALSAKLADDAFAAKVGCGFLRAKQATAEQLKEAASVIVSNHIPVLVISGGWSASADQTAVKLAELLHGKYEKVAAPDHYITADNPDDFNKVADAFMKSVERGP